MQPEMALAGLLVGFVIGLTGMGGGALMTPVLVIFFGIDPSAAISSDVIASLVLKPVGAGVHARRGTVNWRLVRWLMVGSVPTAFAGALLVDVFFGGENAAGAVQALLGWVLLVAAATLVAKIVIGARRNGGSSSDDASMPAELVRPLPTVAIGTLGGLIVGLTSVGSGSLIIVLLMLTYPRLASREMVGTDLVQAVPLVASAALGHLVFGDPRIDVIGSVLLGAVPAVWLGAHVSSRASDRHIRPVLVAVLALSALKLLEVPNAALLTLTIVGAGTFAVTTAALRLRVALLDRDRAHDVAPLDRPHGIQTFDHLAEQVVELR